MNSPKSSATRYDEARAGVLACWTMLNSGKSALAVSRLMGFTYAHARNIDRARKQALPEVKRAFVEGRIGTVRLIALAGMTAEEQREAMGESPYKKRSVPEMRAMLDALLAVPTAERGERGEGAKEALAWCLGMGGSVAGLK